MVKPPDLDSAAYGAAVSLGLTPHLTVGSGFGAALRVLTSMPHERLPHDLERTCAVAADLLAAGRVVRPVRPGLGIA